MGAVVPRSSAWKHTPNEENSTPIKPSPASLATTFQPIMCQNPRGNAPLFSTALPNWPAIPANQTFTLKLLPPLVSTQGLTFTGQCSVKASRSRRPAPENVDKVSIWEWHLLFLVHSERFVCRNVVSAAAVFCTLSGVFVNGQLGKALTRKEKTWGERLNGAHLNDKLRICAFIYFYPDMS